MDDAIDRLAADTTMPGPPALEQVRVLEPAEVQAMEALTVGADGDMVNVSRVGLLCLFKTLDAMTAVARGKP